ncbi:MAG: hypothetical protein QM783_08070 [Phycisphaerales bacterium]
MLEALLEILGGVLEGLMFVGHRESSDAEWHPAAIVLLVVLAVIGAIVWFVSG